MKRKEILKSRVYRTVGPFGKTYVTISSQDEKLIEVFITVGKSGQSLHAKMEAIGRLVSLSLQHNIPVEEIIKQLEGIQGENAFFHKGEKILSLPDFIAYVLRKEIGEEDD